MTKDSFVIYTRYEEQISLLTDEQAGILLRAMIKYQSGQELPQMDGMTQMAFSFIKAKMDEENQKNQLLSNARKLAGEKGGRPSKSLTNKGNKAKKPIAFEVIESDEIIGKNDDTEKQKKQEVFEKTKRFSRETTFPNKERSKEKTPFVQENNPLFISPEGKEKKPFEDEFYVKYPRYEKDRSKMRVDVDYKRLLEEFDKSTYLRNLFTVKQINEIYEKIISGVYRDEDKKPSSIAGADAKADRERWYSVRRNKAKDDAEKIHKRFMQDEEYAKRYNRLREIDILQAKAEAEGDMAKAAELEREKSRLKQEKRGIIERQGMTEEDLETKWHCRKCEDTGFVNGIACSCYEG